MSVVDHLQCDAPVDWVGDFSQCLFEWQGLEGAGLAVLAAVIGAGLLLKQIRQTQRHRDEEISRRHNAARLTLPLSLSAVTELLQRVADEVADEFEQYGPDGFNRTFDAIMEGRAPRTHFEPVALPNEVIGSFERFVESLKRASDIRHVAELMASAQILISRFNSFKLDDAGAKTGLVTLMLNAAKVKLLNEKIFNYARFVDDSEFGIVGVINQNAAWDEIHGAAQSLVFLRKQPDLFFPAYQEHIQGYKDHAISPWNEKFA